MISLFMVYWDIVRFSFLRFFSYPWEIISQALKRLVEILFLVYFWNLAITTGGLQISIRELSSYFLIAVGLADITMSRWGALGFNLGAFIKEGRINNYLIKPVGLIRTIYSISLGRNGLRTLLAIISIAIGLELNFPKSYISALLFVAFFINSFLISFAYNVFEGTLFIHFTEAGGVRNVLQNSIRVISGSMVPLYLFSDNIRKVLEVLPFASMVYWPVRALSLNSINNEVILNILIGLFWAIFLNIAVHLFWKSSIKNYEAIGV